MSSSLETIKEAIGSLPEDERPALAAWLNLNGMDNWDRHMHRDFRPVAGGTTSPKRFVRMCARGNSGACPSPKPRMNLVDGIARVGGLLASLREIAGIDATRGRQTVRSFRKDPAHPFLHFKQVGEFWSVRVTGDCRALALRLPCAVNFPTAVPRDRRQ